MGKKCTPFRVVKNIGSYEDSDGKEKNKWRTIGDLMLFSEQELPEDLTMRCELYSECLPFPDSNPVAIFKSEARTASDRVKKQ